VADGALLDEMFFNMAPSNVQAGNKLVRSITFIAFLQRVKNTAAFNRKWLDCAFPLFLKYF
jgi:hypothetical protein